MKKYLVYCQHGHTIMYLAGSDVRTMFTPDERLAQVFDTQGHAYEAAICLESNRYQVTFVREARRCKHF